MKVDILGSGHSLKDFNYNPERKVWGCSTLTFPDFVPDTIFEMHSYLDKHYVKDKPCKRLVMGVLIDGMKNAIEYPLQEVIDATGTDYYRSTPAYMLGLAILEGATDIMLYGLDMDSTAEYAAQLPSLTYLIGYARGKGIKCEVSQSGILLKSPFLYGYYDNRNIQEYYKQKKKMVEQKKQGAKSEAEYHQWLGYELAIEQQIRLWS